MASRNILLGLKTGKTRDLLTKSPDSFVQTVAGSVDQSSRSDISSLKRKLDEAESSSKTATSPKKQEGSPPKSKPERAAKRQSIIVGVDYGTTYSGVAYVCTTDQHGEVQVLSEYSGGQMQSDVLEKVPTRIAYAFENGGVGAWGYNVKPGMKSYGWFKLQLDGDTDLTEMDDPLLRQSAAIGMNELPAGKDPKDVTADFLRYLHDHIMGKLANHLTKAMLDETPINFHFTMPATWSPNARNLTREAATIAGYGIRPMDELYMIDEPEAAAIASMKATIGAFPEKNHFEEGEGVIVADIGGGTADLVSYKIISLLPLELEEICIGVGAKCGGTSADRALHELFGRRYGTAFTTQPMSKIGPGSKFMDSWERIKRDFNGEDMGQQFELHLKMSGMDTDSKGYDFDTDEIILTADDLVKTLETVVTPSIGLVREQLALIRKRKKPMTVHKIILVGGMGSSPYMVKRFKAFCDDEMKGKIVLVTSMKAWSAVCRGAAHRGLEDSPVLTRRARCNYGFLIHVQFVKGKHLEEDAFDDEINGKRAKDQMIWPTRKNTAVKPGQKKITVCYYTIPPGTATFTPRIVLYKCAEDNPPTRKDHTEQILTKLVRDERKRLIGNGSITENGSFELVVRLHLKLGSEKGVLEAHATSLNRTVGQTRINYEGDSLWERDAAQDVKPKL